MKIKLDVHWIPTVGRHFLGSSDIGAAEISGWLNDDLAGDLAAIDFWLSKFEKVANDNTGSGETSAGNAHYVMLAKNGVLIDAQFEEDKRVFLTYKQVDDVLKNYKKFIEADFGGGDLKPSSFDVEYEEFGESAVSLYKNIAFN